MLSNSGLDLRKYASCWGYWLADAPEPYSKLYFDITDLKSYPPEIPKGLRRELQYYVNQVKTLHTSFRVLDLEDDSNNDSLKLVVDNLRKLLGKYDIYKEIPVSTRYHPSEYEEVEDVKTLKKRKFFLHVARLVASGSESISSAARKFNVSKANVTIWSSIYLSHGAYPFFHCRSKKEPSVEAVIIRNHFINQRSVVRSCIVHHIFSTRAFHNILRRHKHLIPNPSS